MTHVYTVLAYLIIMVIMSKKNFGGGHLYMSYVCSCEHIIKHMCVLIMHTSIPTGILKIFSHILILLIHGTGLLRSGSLIVPYTCVYLSLRSGSISLVPLS